MNYIHTKTAQTPFCNVIKPCNTATKANDTKYNKIKSKKSFQRQKLHPPTIEVFLLLETE